MSIDIIGSQAAFSGFAAPRVGLTFSITKRFMDVAVSLALLPLLAVCAVLLLVMNHILNRGPLLFCQIRMGRGGRAFVAYKFRSMKPGHGKIRGPLWPGYRARLGVRPGISGYAQTEVGHAQGLEDIRKNFGPTTTTSIIRALHSNFGLFGGRCRRLQSSRAIDAKKR